MLEESSYRDIKPDGFAMGVWGDHKRLFSSHGFRQTVYGSFGQASTCLSRTEEEAWVRLVMQATMFTLGQMPVDAMM